MAGKIAESIRFSISQSALFRLLARFAVAWNSRAGQNLLRPVASTDQTRATVAAHVVHLGGLPIRFHEEINLVSRAALGLSPSVFDLVAVAA